MRERSAFCFDQVFGVNRGRTTRKDILDGADGATLCRNMKWMVDFLGLYACVFMSSTRTFLDVWGTIMLCSV